MGIAERHIVRLRVERLEAREVPTAGYFRIVEYNVASVGSPGTVQTGLDLLLQGMGNEHLNGNTQQVDLVALQEVKSQVTTCQDVANKLNAIFSTTAYLPSTLDGDSTGSGTQGIVYNSQTLQLISEAAIGTAGTAPAQPRQALRYKMHPIGYPTSADFFLYNSHYKADNDSISLNRKLVEATAIRADADNTVSVPANANIMYVGDFNTYTSSEAGYQKLLSAGNGQAIDPLNRPGSWSNTASFKDIFTQAPLVTAPSPFTGGGLDDRFDFQLFTSELIDGVGLDYVPGTYHTFGNNGTVNLNGNINDASNTALDALPNGDVLLDYLTTVSDHLPVVADYRFIPPTTVTAVTVNDGISAQRSRVTSLTVTFSNIVTFPSGANAAFQLKRQVTDASVTLNAVASNSATQTTVTITFTSGAIEFGSLIDGRYTLTVVAANVASTQGGLDGNGDFTPGDNYVLVGNPTNAPKLFRLYGDSDGNGTVDQTDFIAFRNAFNAASSTFDFDGSGLVDQADFTQFRNRFNTIV